MTMDARALINYINSESNLFKMINTHIGQIFAATPVIGEVDSIISFEKLRE